jgi:Ca2+-binding RTX toxin-like protein
MSPLNWGFDMVTAAGASFIVNTQNNAQPQGESDLAILSNGNIVVVWTDQKNGEDHSDIRGQLFSSTGALIGSDFEVNADTTNPQVKASVVALADGAFAVGWEDGLTNTNLEDTTSLEHGRADQLRMYTSNSVGAAAGSITEVYRYGENGAQPWIFDVGPELFVFNGTLAYGHTKVLEQGVVAAVGDTITMRDANNPQSNYFNHPDFAAINGGIATVADSFLETNLSGDGSDLNGVFLRLPNVANLIHVNATTALGQNFARVAAVGTGVIVTWFDASYVLKARFVKADGTLGTEMSIGSTDSPNYDIAETGDGRVVVVWAYDADIRLAVLKSDGSTQSLITVDDQVAHTGSDPAVSIVGSTIVVSWTDQQGGSSAGDIRARVFTFDGGAPPTGDDPTAGDDNLVGTEGKDKIDALAGNDTVQGLGGKDTLEGGGGNDSLNGGAAADKLDGDGGKDTLAGGAGDDTLTGGKGKDFFLFDTKLGGKNVDDITDFKVKDDTIWLDHDIFSKIALGPLKAKAFVSNDTGKAEDKKDRIVYNEDNGKLYYDADGSKSGKAVQFATLDKHLHLTHDDFVIV